MRYLLGLIFVTIIGGCSDVSETEPITVEFLNLRIESLSSTRAVAKFETSIPTSCEVEYGLASDALNIVAVDPDMPEDELAIEHEVPLEDLDPDTTYFWRGFVKVQGQEFRSETLSFTTPAAELDDTDTLVNYAINPTILSVSSNFGGSGNAGSWGVLNAFDGEMATEWATQGDGDNASVEIDLGAVRGLTHIAFRSRKMSDGISIIQEFQVVFDGQKSLGPFSLPDPDQRYVFVLDTPVDAQVVRIEATKTTGGNTGAKEIEFLGPDF
jgi:hypothetical protein